MNERKDPDIEPMRVPYTALVLLAVSLVIWAFALWLVVVARSFI